MTEVTNDLNVTGYEGITSLSNSATATSSQTSSNLYKGDSVFSYGLSVLFLFMDVLSEQANAQYANMESQSQAARKAQEHASSVDGQIADLASGKTTTLNPEVKKYIEDNQIEIDGVCFINDYGSFEWTNSTTTVTIMTDNGQTHTQTVSPGQPLNLGRDEYFISSKTSEPTFTAGQLTAIKGALDSTANRSTDFVSTAQLQLQKQMQTYNVCVSLINSMQSMLADMNKTIAQGIR